MTRVNPLLAQVGTPPNLASALGMTGQLLRYVTHVVSGNRPVDPHMNDAFQRELIQYHNNAMALRTGAHPFMGAAIQRNINQFPACTHIITCGNAHLTVNNPLYNYVNLPLSTVGVVDASQN